MTGIGPLMQDPLATLTCRPDQPPRRRNGGAACARQGVNEHLPAVTIAGVAAPQQQTAVRFQRLANRTQFGSLFLDRHQ